MRIAGLTDLHGKIVNFNKILLYNPDIIVISGDITHFGRNLRIIDYLKCIMEKEGIEVLTVPGNCDTKNTIDKLNNVGINIDEKLVNIDSVKFVGLGGSNKTPFNTPNEYTEEELLAKFKNATKNVKKELLLNNFIFITHAPPKNTMADRVNNCNVGSKAVRKIIEEYQPSLVICGHIHESRCIDKIKNSYIVNPSQDSFLLSDIYLKNKGFGTNIKIKNIELVDF
jgi:hypothetical protein